MVPGHSVPGGYGGPWMAAAITSIGGTNYIYALGGVYGDSNDKTTGMWGAVDTSAGSVGWQPIDDIGGMSTSGSAIAVQGTVYLFPGGLDNNVNDGPTTKRQHSGRPSGTPPVPPSSALRSPTAASMTRLLVDRDLEESDSCSANRGYGRVLTRRSAHLGGR